MFWGLIMEPGKKYSQVVEKDFHIAQAALDLDSAQSSPVQVLISIDGRNYLVCTLIKDKICQANLDLNFRAGAKVSFATNGPGHVHLTGYLIEDNEFVMEEDSDDEIGDEESADELEEIPTKKRKAQQSKQDKPNKKTKTAMLLDQLDEESYNEDDDSNVNLNDLMDDSDSDDDSAVDEETDDEEVDDEDGEDEKGSDYEDDGGDSDEEESSEEDVKPKVSPKKSQESPKQNGVAKKTPKNEKVQKVDKTPKVGDKSPKNEKSPKGQKTPVQENQKTPKGNKSPGGGESGTPGKKSIQGVMIEDLKTGEGQVAKSGRNVRVYYEGRLKSNNKVFDSSNKGPGFKFRLGKQEVIKGWDIGLAGMKVGGKRRITCPPHMAYGAAGSPPVIPPNSTLVFEVELKQVF